MRYFIIYFDSDNGNSGNTTIESYMYPSQTKLTRQIQGRTLLKNVVINDVNELNQADFKAWTNKL